MVMMPDVPSDKYTYKLLRRRLSKGLCLCARMSEQLCPGECSGDSDGAGGLVYENTNNYSVGLMIQFGDGGVSFYRRCRNGCRYRK